jgi:2-iminobutanoate/2-iminopropanoate deaminase
MSQPIEVIATPAAPPAIGPYSQAIRAGDFVFVSGQVAVDVRTDKLAEGIAAQTRQVMDNLRAVLAAAGASLDRVVKVTIFLGRWEDFGAMNDVYASYFGAKPPARSVVQGHASGGNPGGPRGHRLPRLKHDRAGDQMRSRRSSRPSGVSFP